VELKEDDSPVTVADREAEQVLRDLIHGRYPDWGIVGEEFEDEERESEYRWIIDPIDGTKSFVAGVPLYTVLLALCRKDEPLVGVVHSPGTGETAAAYRGGGCLYNSKSTQMRPSESLAHSLVLTTDFNDLARRMPIFADRLFRSEAAGRTWADGYGYLMLASGRADAMIDPIVHPWDVAAVKPVIQEAGGRITDVAGRAAGLGSSVIAASPALHAELLELAE
jgi:myo-inositol-1(or 4)-monophosphatase